MTRTISRLVLLFFCLYLFYAFSQKYLPDSPVKVIIFVFLFMLNGGTQAACYHMLNISDGWQQWLLLAFQGGMAAWTVYAYQFMFDWRFTGDKVILVLQTPLLQWLIIIPLMLLIIMTNKRGR
jgi:hypothetical protein